jgi:predicted alpha/beta hydrolase family esterase
MCLVLAAGAWLLSWWGQSVAVALLGCAAIVFGYTVFLALGFVALRSVNALDPVGAPSWRDLVQAWWLETRVVVQVFLWRQPFRSTAVEDFLPRNGRRGVVFVHGFVCNRGLWTPWLKILRAKGNAFIAVNLEPVFGSIDGYAATIADAVQRVMDCTGHPPVLVCHSMGGLSARAWLRNAADDSKVHCIVTIGTPHHGTLLAKCTLGTNGQQLRRSSDWLHELESHETVQSRVRFTCWYSNCDNVVIPASTGSLAGADNRLVPSVGHMALAFCPEVMLATMEMITDSVAPAPLF